MPELTFAIEAATVIPNTTVPTLAFAVRLADSRREPAPIHSILLRTQVRILPARRRYEVAEQERLLPLFDRPERWGKTVREMLWVHLTAIVPPFTSATTVELQTPCSCDFSLASTQYFDALEAGDIPLCFLFSGTVFYEAPEGGLQVMQIPWDKEAGFRLPVATWKTLMEQHYGNTAWMGLRKDVFDRLQQFKCAHGLPNWEQTFAALLNASESETA